MRKNLADQRRLGRWVRAHRLRTGVSQEKLAERAKTSAKHVGEIERGEVDVGFAVLNRITEALSTGMPQLRKLRRGTTSDGDILTAEEVAHLRQTIQVLQRLVRLGP